MCKKNPEDRDNLSDHVTPSTLDESLTTNRKKEEMTTNLTPCHVHVSRLDVWKRAAAAKVASAKADAAYLDAAENFLLQEEALEDAKNARVEVWLGYIDDDAICLEIEKECEAQKVAYKKAETACIESWEAAEAALAEYTRAYAALQPMSLLTHQRRQPVGKSPE